MGACCRVQAHATRTTWPRNRDISRLGRRWTNQPGFAVCVRGKRLPRGEQALSEPHVLEPELEGRAAGGRTRGMLETSAKRRRVAAPIVS